jgi:hypothetical protein
LDRQRGGRDDARPTSKASRYDTTGLILQAGGIKTKTQKEH